MQHYTECFSITKVFHALQKCFKHCILFHVSNKVGKPKQNQSQILANSRTWDFFIVIAIFASKIPHNTAKYHIKVVILYTVDLEHNTYKVYSITDSVDDIKTVVEDYSDLSSSLRQYADGYVYEEDREKIYYYANLDNMRAALRNARSQKVVVRRNIDGEWAWIEMNMIKVEPISEPAEDDKEKVLDYLSKTQRAGSMLLSLINNVLEVSRIEAGEATVEEQPGDVFLSFSNINTTMQELAGTKDIKLTFSFGRVQDRYVYADFNRCMRIFVNIISTGNARRKGS